MTDATSEQLKKLEKTVDEMLDDTIKHREWLENIAETLQELTDRIEKLEEAVGEL